jgi:hypothetical protein
MSATTQTQSAVRSTGSGRIGKILLAIPFTLAVLVVGFGTPLLWLLIGAKIQGASGVTHMTTETAIAVYPGVAVTYAFVGYLAAEFAARLRGGAVPQARHPRAPSHPWLRAMSDEPESVTPPTGLEKIFILAAGSLTIAFTVWFFAWAGSPLPSA